MFCYYVHICTYVHLISFYSFYEIIHLTNQFVHLINYDSFYYYSCLFNMLLFLFDYLLLNDIVSFYAITCPLCHLFCYYMFVKYINDKIQFIIIFFIILLFHFICYVTHLIWIFLYDGYDTSQNIAINYILLLIKLI